MHDAVHRPDTRIPPADVSVGMPRAATGRVRCLRRRGSSSMDKESALRQDRDVSPVRRPAHLALVLSCTVGLIGGCSELVDAAANLQDGAYNCVAVFVNQENKYELYVDDFGDAFTGFARVEGGEVVSYSAPNALGWREGVTISVRKSGSSRFHATQDLASHSYDALACEWSET